MTRLFFALALVIACAFPVPASAADCDGVTVVVDFGSLGGGVQQGCAPGGPASGVAALTAAGFGYTYASRQPGFVCRIDGKPGADADKCVNTPPASAYWSYWHASAGGSWVYSNQGAATYVPARGSVEGWAFGAGAQPGTAPPTAAPAPAPQPPAPQPPAPKPPAPPVVTTAVPPTSSAAPSPSSEPVPPATTSSTAETSAVVVEQKAQRAEEEPGPRWWWTAAGVLVIAGLVVAGALVARRRRRAEEE
ncbi:hypothetical protein [Lentzea sp. NPDC004782]|uniref:hypothetical protein n=1 Tax=Lentzea sp. NPDC004782 TaxID=3154458 RepID=UPI0033BF076E